MKSGNTLDGFLQFLETMMKGGVESAEGCIQENSPPQYSFKELINPHFLKDHIQTDEPCQCGLLGCTGENRPLNLDSWAELLDPNYAAGLISEVQHAIQEHKSLLEMPSEERKDTVARIVAECTEKFFN